MRIISREEWGARYDRGFHDRDLPVSEIWLHHSVTIAPDLIPPFDDDYAAVRLLEQIGESRFGGGISYTFPITPAGLIFEGHGVETSGAHTLNRNDFASAICWIGNYDVNDPPEPMIRATAWLLVHGKRQGWWTNARLSGGHGQAPGQSTACPGRRALAVINRVNTLAADYEAGRINLDEEDDVSADDVMNYLVPVGYDNTKPPLPFVQVTRGTNHGVWETHAAAVRIEQNQAAQAAVLAAIAEDAAVTAERLQEIVNDAVAAANAAHLAQVAALLDEATGAVRDIVGARDENLAAEVVDEISRRTNRAA